MTALLRTSAMLTALALAAGCTGPRRFDRRMNDVRLPTAPVLEPSPGPAAAPVDPEKVGTVGSPSPAPEPPTMPATPTLSPFGE